MWQFWAGFILLAVTIILGNYWVTKYQQSNSFSANDFRNIVITYNIRQDSFYVNNEFDDISRGVYSGDAFHAFFTPGRSLVLFARQLVNSKSTRVGRSFKVMTIHNSKYMVRVETIADNKIVFGMMHNAFDEADRPSPHKRRIAKNQEDFIQKGNEALMKNNKAGIPTIIFRVKIAGYERISKKYTKVTGAKITEAAAEVYSKRNKKSIVFRDTYKGSVYIITPIEKDTSIQQFENMFISELKNLNVHGVNFALNAIITGSYVDEAKFHEIQHRFDYLEMDAGWYGSFFKIYDHISDTQKFREYLENGLKIIEDTKNELVDLTCAQIYDLSQDLNSHYMIKAETHSVKFPSLAKQDKFLEINGIKTSFEKNAVRNVMEKVFKHEDIKNKMFHINAHSSTVAENDGVRIPAGYVENISITLTDWSYNERTTIQNTVDYLKKNNVKVGLNYIYSFETLKNALTFEPDYIFVSKKLLKTSYENGTNKEQLRLINEICEAKNIMVIFEDINTRLDVDLVLSIGGRFIQGEMITPYTEHVTEISSDNEQEIRKAKQYVFY